MRKLIVALRNFANAPTKSGDQHFRTCHWEVSSKLQAAEIEWKASASALW